MRLFRTIFFLGVVAVLMPSPPEDRQNSAEAERQLTTPEVVYVASRTASDLGGFCSREPMVCDTAGVIAAKLEAKAKYGARLIYEWANETSAPTPRIETDLSTPSLPLGEPPVSQNTLTREDFLPEWRDPNRPRRS